MKGSLNANSNFGRACNVATDKFLSDPLTISVCACNADFSIIVSRPLNEAERARDMAREMEGECPNS